MVNLFNIKKAEVFYARHITHGISKYKAGNVLITKPVLDKMNDSFTGKPVVITHKDWEKQEPVGYVVKSFYIPQDGYFWVEFIINNKEALEFINNQNYKVSNGYVTTASGVGGKFHDIDYVEEVLDGEYVHLALTKEPKFAEAIILSKQEFKDFTKKLEEIDNKFNETEDKMFFFKKQKVDNSEEILGASFELGGKDYTVKQMIDMLSVKMNEEEKKYATCNGEFTAEELVGKYNDACETIRKNEEEKAKAEEEKKNEEEAKKKAEEEAKAKAEEEAKKKAEEDAKKQNEKLNSRMNANEPKKVIKKVTFQATKDGGIKIIEE